MATAFKVHAPWTPAGSQPQAIKELTAALKDDQECVTMLGITGSGKSAVVAWTVEQLQRPTLVLAPNKSLAAQLASEFMALLPENRVELFMSYYDYYQPEAYMPASDMFIEKESTRNSEIDRLRHSTTEALTTRRDVLVVASVSGIYSLGPPAEYANASLQLKKGESIDTRQLAAKMVAMGFDRTDNFLERGRFRIRGDVFEYRPPSTEDIVRVELFGDEIERVRRIDVLNGTVLQELESTHVFPSTHWTTPVEKITPGVERIKEELDVRLKEFKKQDKVLEYHRLKERTERDLELLEETGFCPGIENYSAQMEGRPKGEPPWTLLDYFDKDFLVVLDESHVSLPQVAGSYAGDHSRKATLIEHGFRLPSAADNRPLTFDEFLGRVPQMLCVSATPGPYEQEHSETTVQLVVRPTGLLDPQVEILSVVGQVDSLTEKAKEVIKENNRVLVTCLTKKNAEDLAEHLTAQGLKCRYLHSDVETLERIELLRDLRLGVFDVLVGINLLREGLDLPEVSLVAVLDEDKAGFLRSHTALVQTMGRAARNANGKVLLYADKITPAIKSAVAETSRRRDIQKKFNTKHNITPQTIRKDVADLLAETGVGETLRKERKAEEKTDLLERLQETSVEDLRVELETEMGLAAEDLRFEEAAALRDKLATLSRIDQ